MTELVSYQLQDSVAVVTLDDGKVNALSRQMLTDIDGALDRAVADGAIVVLTGRPGVFSAGFDLRVLRAGGEEALAMVRAGFELAARVLSFPRPVVIACNGHAIAMGAFLLLSGDYRVGAAGLERSPRTRSRSDSPCLAPRLKSAASGSRRPTSTGLW